MPLIHRLLSSTIFSSILVVALQGSGNSLDGDVKASSGTSSADGGGDDNLQSTRRRLIRSRRRGGRPSPREDDGDVGEGDGVDKKDPEIDSGEGGWMSSEMSFQ